MTKKKKSVKPLKPVLVISGVPGVGKSRLARFLKNFGFAGEIQEELPSCNRSKSRRFVYLDLHHFEENQGGN